MPNIEIHGEGEEGFIKALRNRIFEAIRTKDIELASKVVVTSVSDICVDIALRSKPFLRIISPKADAKKIQQIIECLKPIGMDMEIVTSDSFIPGRW